MSDDDLDYASHTDFLFRLILCFLFSVFVLSFAGSWMSAGWLFLTMIVTMAPSVFVLIYWCFYAEHEFMVSRLRRYENEDYDDEDDDDDDR